MRISLTLAIILGVLAAQVRPAMAQNDDDDKLKVGDYAPDFEAEDWINVQDEGIPSLAELRGLVIVVFFWVGRHEGGDVVIKYVNQYENDPAIGKTGGVYTIGLTDATRRATERLRDEHKVFFPIGVKSDAAEEYGIEGGFGFVVIDAEGKVAFKGSGGDLQGMGNALVDTLNKTPPTKTHPIEARKVRRLLDEAQGEIAEGHYRRAFKVARDAFDRAVLGDPLKSQVFEVFDFLEAIGYERLDRVQPLIEEGEFREAADTVRWVRTYLPVLDAGKDAKKMYEELQERYDGFHEAAQAHVAEDEAAKILYEARDDLLGKRVGAAYDKLQNILTDYAQTRAADYAREWVDRMKASAVVWPHVRDHVASADCEMWLAQARSHIRRREYSKAQQLLRRILLEHPDTIYSEQAKQMLIEMD